MLEKKTLTTGEIAKHCGVHFRTVIRWIERGHLQAYKLPGRGDHRVQLDDFLVFLEKNNMPIPEEFQPKNNRILIADDDAEMAFAIQRVLRKQGYETEIAKDGFKAGVLLGSFMPALMTLDLKMPGAGGFEVLQFVKDTKYLANLKVIVISGMPEDQLLEAKKAGADDIISKPFDNEELIKKTRKLMGS